MDINSIKLGKIQGKKSEINKAEDKGFQVPEDRTSDPSILEKIRKSATSYAVAAMMMASLASCISQEQYNDTSRLEALMAELLELQKQQNEEMAALRALIQQNNADNKELIALAEKQLAEQQKIYSIIEKLYADFDKFSSNITGALNDIIELVRKSHGNDEEFMAMLEQILNSELDGNKKLDAILKAINEQNEMILHLTDLVGTIKGDLGDTLNAFFDAYKNGEISKSEMMEKIFAALNKSNDLNAEQLEAIKNIQKQLESGQLSAAEALAKITELLASIDSKLDGLMAMVEALGLGNEDLKDAIKGFHNDFKDDSITENAILAKILGAIEQYGAKDPEVLGYLEKFQQLLEQGNLTFNDIKDLLNKINVNTEGIWNEVKGLSQKVGDLAVTVEGNQDESLAILKNINDGVGSVNTKLDQVIKNQEADNKMLVEISSKIDKSNAQLGEINDKTVSKADLVEILGPLYTDVADIKKAIDGLGRNITIQEVQDILNGYKTDLTKTNSLIETLTSVVQNKNFTGDSSELLAVLKDIKNNGSMTREEVNANLQEVLEKLASIDGTLKALQTTATAILEKQNEFMEQAFDLGADFMTEVKKVAQNTGDINTLVQLGEDYREVLLQAEKTRQEQKAILQAILEKEGTQGSGGASITVNELKEIIPDYTDILNEISAKLGNVITSSDLENYFLKTKPDLTKTNSLIETLTSVVQNKNFSGGSGSADMSRVESLLGQLIDALNNKSLPTEAQLQELIEAAEKVVANITASSDSTPSGTKSIAALLNDMQTDIYNKTGVKGTYFLDPAIIYSRMHQA